MMSADPDLVSIIVPCFNEEATIELLLTAVARQDFPTPCLEVIIADGMSEDQTRDRIATFMQQNPGLHIRIVDNKKRVIPAALNVALEASRGEYILRLDAHSIPDPAYVRTCVELLQNEERANVGGVWEIKPGNSGCIARGIAVAASHPLGSGGVRYRVGGSAGSVDTVPFGAFRRSWLEQVGRFNEDLLTNEDYEYNLRLRNAGGEVYFDPRIKSTYLARSDLGALTRQYLRYGYWKAKMLIKNPEAVRLRQLIPPIFVLSTLLLLMLSPLLRGALMTLGFMLMTYFILLITSALLEAWGRKDPGLLFCFPLALITIHTFWGGAFILGVLSSLVPRVTHETD